MRQLLVVADVAPVEDLLVHEQVAEDQQLAVGQRVGAGVAEAEAAVVVVEEGQQLGGRVEPDERRVRGAAVLQGLHLRGRLVDDVLLVDQAAVTVLRVEDVAVLPLAPEHTLHELEDLVALLDVVVGLDHLQREQPAAAHAEADGADAPVVDRVDLRADLRARAWRRCP